VFQNKTATIAFAIAIIIASAVLIGLGVVIINPTINSYAQALGVISQQFYILKQDIVTIQKIEVSSLDPVSEEPVHMSKMEIRASASNDTLTKNLWKSTVKYCDMD
jgi:3-polyprenyl-4-hydroxybenzoate decarboxylase